MQRTLLYTVQRVLEKLNLDPVNSINDTEDSLLVVREAESTFYDLMSRAEWKDKEEQLRVESVSDVNIPTSLRIPDEVYHISFLRYDVTESGDEGKTIRRIQWLEPQDFLEKSYRLNTSHDNVDEVSYNGTPVFIVNDKMPEYYTSFDNKVLVLDSYDSAEETTLNGSKSSCYGKKLPTWTESDSFVIPVEESVYPLYLAMLSSACSIYMNSEVNQEDERRQARGLARMRREHIATEMEYFPKFKYGREGNGLA